MYVWMCTGYYSLICVWCQERKVHTQICMYMCVCVSISLQREKGVWRAVSGRVSIMSLVCMRVYLSAALPPRSLETWTQSTALVRTHTHTHPLALLPTLSLPLSLSRLICLASMLASLCAGSISKMFPSLQTFQYLEKGERERERSV